jgi:hypothetical protein
MDRGGGIGDGKSQRMRVRRRVNVPTGTNNQQDGTRDTTPRHRDGDAGTINTRPRTWRETVEAVMEAIADVGFCDVRLERGEKCGAWSIFEGNQRGGAWQDPWAGATSFFRHDSADSERGQLGAKKGVKKSTRVVFDTKTKATAGYSQTTARTRASSHHHSTFSDSHGVEFLAHIANLSPLLSPTPNSFSAPPSRRLFLAFPKPRGLPKCSHSIPLPRPKL